MAYSVSIRTATVLLTDFNTAEYVAKYANKDSTNNGNADTESDGEMSSVGSYQSDGEEPAGAMDDV